LWLRTGHFAVFGKKQAAPSLAVSSAQDALQIINVTPAHQGFL
jgi:hypothetical protein